MAGDKLNDDLVTLAIAREAELRRELEKITTFLSVYRELTGTVDGNVSSASAMDVTDRFDTPQAGATLPPQGMRQTEFVPFVRAMMLDNKRPMQPQEILRAFHKKGRHVGGSNEAENLKSKLWRAKSQIINIGGSGYWPIDVPCPEVSYMPPESTSDSDNE